MAHFSDKGTHCSDPYCRQNDFLPFTCDLCNKVFCLDHHGHEAHNCPLAKTKDKRVLVCPICTKSIPLPQGVTPDNHDQVALLYDQHSRSGHCNAAAAKKEKCPVTKCKEVLTTLNKYSCRKCGQTVCMKHRFETDHDCATVARSCRAEAASSRARGTGAVGGVFRNLGRLVNGGNDRR
uniref:AN1-type domain-containing protein n=1 Tax=Chromera velia CCMP2878 TaxID=1169474 RepID=A0A0G4G776_9ALVE|mmetsp:Transcript_52849/g.103349  ORF Transcript_52849/g.103349 Transcript_52849/m.103349 type:complete len:179 (-) Transcript_52849:447-983(-)|eukprot:Cvel_20589.t1-p1 / transcript=Cvel_20589.t1 / gene=Cvel_20589 / organism=Chromera_velia_CCMP2878 / gene_product=Zinc finger AN1 domain-containing stress-associated, putative / transcript_product=Zinc finger AN1 domain-containing stress-associated, putative / location=Cvel_scaffold1860:33746-34279(+) / protein_length=178 / sequence_SO=supercontig / SO=protein_coding / is_pseudo=false